MKWLDPEEYPAKIKNLYVVEGNKALNIINQPVLKKKSPICQVDHLNISIYKLAEDSYLILSEEKDLNYFASATQLLDKWISAAENVIALSIQSKFEFKGPKTEEVCFFRAVNSKLPEVEELEVPNFVTGLSGGICSYRKFKKQSEFSCYVFYTETFDAIAIKKFLGVAAELGLPYDQSVQIRSLNQQNGNLYC